MNSQNLKPYKQSFKIDTAFKPVEANQKYKLFGKKYLRKLYYKYELWGRLSNY